MLQIASKPIGLWIPSSYSTPESSPLDVAFLSALICIALWILSRRGFNWNNAMKQNPWLIMLIALMLVSILWSNIPFVSFKRWVRELQAVLMAFIVLSEPSPRQTIESILRRMAYVLIPFSPVLIHYFPQYGRLYVGRGGGVQWVGVAMQKNGLAVICFISVFFLIWSLLGRRQRHIAPVWKYQTHAEISIILISIYLMSGPRREIFYVATAVYSLAIGLFVYWGLHISRKHGINIGAGALMTIVTLVIMVGISILFIGTSLMQVMATAAGRDATLTGRTEIWAGLLPVAMERPILGTGFGGFWTSLTKTVFTVSEAHSGYLELLLELGFVGILSISLFLLSFCRKAQQELFRDFDWGVLCICFLMMFVVHNITEASINTLTNLLTAVVLLLSVSSTEAIPHRRQF
jgi:O-antigen ligase